MKLYEMHFNRKFSTPLRRRLSLPVGEMSFENDFIGDKRSDLYPVLSKTGDVSETSEHQRYTAQSFKGGEVTRLIGEFFPYYTYSFMIGSISSAEIGLSLSGATSLFALAGEHGCRIVFHGKEILRSAEGVRDGDVFSVTFRAEGVSLYLERDGKEVLIGDVCDKEHASKITDIQSDGLSSLLSEKIYKKTDAALTVSLYEGGKASLDGITVSLRSGIGTADVRPVKYADGTPIVENGRVFLTASARLETGCYQSVLSWSSTTSDFRMEGALFFDTGDGMCANDVASTVIYDKERERWYIWYCSFSHGHVLGRAELDADPRFGISIIDAELMKVADESTDLTDFAGFFGDEDPDLVLIDGVWHLAVCRHESDGYHYYRFTSSNPLDGFTFADRTPGAEKTGGSFVKLGDEYYFACGSDFKKRAVYDIYAFDDFSTPHPMQHRHDDGGFRGWGSVFSVPVGTRKRVFHITFDRFLTSKKWNWSYGNLYVFEAEEHL